MWYDHSHGLTGNIRFKNGWFGRVIVEVEELFKTYGGWDLDRKNPASTYTKWRKAKIEDFTQKSLQSLSIV